MKILLCTLAAAGLFGQSPGSLFTTGGRLADSTRDLRASDVNDIVTIVVADRASAIAKGTTGSSRKSSAAHSIKALGGALPITNPLANLVNLTNDQQLQGQGATTRDMVLSTTISARVTEVTANGTLVVEGTKEIAVNSEKQTIILSGLIRQSDVSPTNTIRSDQIANLRIKVNGKGVVGDAIKRPFILYRILLGLLPF